MNREVVLTLDTMAHGGAALGRHEGRVVFVPYGLPGETVRVRLTRERKRWAEAELIEVIEPSPERVPPRCEHFGPHKCGGCQWQHIAYESQLRFKTAIVRDLLQRIGRFKTPPVRDCLGDPSNAWMYRNNVQLHVTEHGQIGFVNADSTAVYPIDVCYIQNPVVYDLFQQIKEEQPGEDVRISVPDRPPDVPSSLRRIGLRGSTRTGDRLVLLEVDDPDRAPALIASPTVPVALRRARRDRLSATVALRGSPWIEEELGGRRWRVSADSFFQVNTTMAERLLALVRDFSAPLDENTRILDAYAGVGTFGLSLAVRGGLTWLVEAHPEAIADAHINARGLENVRIVEGRAETVLPNWPPDWPRPDLAILDPPRAGCERAVLDALVAFEVPRIVYVSCDPATLARDLRRLADAGYQLDTVQPIDLFPQTYHVETVVRLRLKEGGRP